MTDDPHDAFHPVVRDGVWWCQKHNEDAETCDCERGDGSQAIIVVLAVAIVMFLIIAAILVL